MPAGKTLFQAIFGSLTAATFRIQGEPGGDSQYFHFDCWRGPDDTGPCNDTNHDVNVQSECSISFQSSSLHHLRKIDQISVAPCELKLTADALRRAQHSARP